MTPFLEVSWLIRPFTWVRKTFTFILDHLFQDVGTRSFMFWEQILNSLFHFPTNQSQGIPTRVDFIIECDINLIFSNDVHLDLRIFAKFRLQFHFYEHTLQHVLHLLYAEDLLSPTFHGETGRGLGDLYLLMARGNPQATPWGKAL